MIKKNPNGYGFSLDDAVVGDKLMISYGFSNRTYKEVTITKVSRTQITLCNNSRWMKDSHRMVGSNIWSRVDLYLFNQKLIDETKEKVKKFRLITKIQETKLIDLSLEALEGIIKIIDDAQLEKAKS